LSHLRTFLKNYQFQIFLPFHKDEYNKKFEAPILPPIFDGSGNKSWVHQYFDVRDMSSNEKVENEKEYITIHMQNINDAELVTFNPKTNSIEEAKYDENKIVEIYMVEKDFRIDLNKK
jgi:hypothetical protein